MPTRTETYQYRVQRWKIPVKSYWLPQRWTLQDSVLRADIPSPGHGVPPKAKASRRGKRTTWEWEDSLGEPRRLVAIKLKTPVTETYEYQNV